MSKVKILLVGPVQGQVSTLINKLKALQSSKAGPFDVCFCVGPFLGTESNNSNREDGGEKKEEPTDLYSDLPLPVYLHDYSGERLRNNAETDEQGIVTIAPNLFYLQGSSTEPMANLYRLVLGDTAKPLLVASCPPQVQRIDAENCKPLLDKCKDSNGCDILLTMDWPQGMEDVLQVDNNTTLSFDTAQLSLNCQPRYHVSPSSDPPHFHQSPAYQYPLNKRTSTTSTLLGRFLALAPVSACKTTKTNKYIHALGLAPLLANPTPDPASTAAILCPFSTPSISDPNSANNKHPLPSFVQQARAQAPSSSFNRFDTASGKHNSHKRKGREDDQQDEAKDTLAPPDDPNISTLFLYGLHKDVTGELQSTKSSVVLEWFQKYKIRQVRHIPSATTSTYCFLEFPSQQEALECLLDCQGQVTIKGIPLTLKWATASSSTNSKKSKISHPAPTTTNHYVTYAEASHSTTLYFHPDLEWTRTNSNATASKVEGMGSNSAEFVAFAEQLRKYMEQVLEQALNEGNDNDEDRVTAETEPALQVKVRAKETYGFLEFASHAAATMALAAVTTSTDGGILTDPTTTSTRNNNTTPKPPSTLIGTTLRWARGAPPAPAQSKSEQQASYLEALGLERKHFPPDSRTDCWFCLASPTCEKHLITGVYDECYVAMPKGPIHPGHVLCVPVTHSSRGAWMLSCRGELYDSIKSKLQLHASQVYDCDLFVFERAMETKGGYHTHVQCVPVPRGLQSPIQTFLLAHAKACGFELRPIESDLGVATLMKDDGDYFYVELIGDSYQVRYLYQRSNNNDIRTASSRSSVGVGRVPLQFGREVLAAVLKNPDFAHWKSCVVDKEKETELAKDFRTSFAPFDPSSES